MSRTALAATRCGRLRHQQAELLELPDCRAPHPLRCSADVRKVADRHRLRTERPQHVGAHPEGQSRLRFEVVRHREGHLGQQAEEPELGGGTADGVGQRGRTEVVAENGEVLGQRSLDGCGDRDECFAQRAEPSVCPTRVDIRHDLFPDPPCMTARWREVHDRFAIPCPGCSLDVGRVADVAPPAHPVKRRVDGCRCTRVSRRPPPSVLLPAARTEGSSRTSRSRSARRRRRGELGVRTRCRSRSSARPTPVRATR